MGQRSSYAAMKDAQIELRMEECVSSMGQRSSDAIVKDAQIKLRKEDCASSMGQIALRRTNPLLLDQISNRLLHPYPISALLMLHTKEAQEFLEK